MPIDQALSSSLLASILRSTPDGVLIVDQAGNVLTYNAQFVDLWGLPSAVLEQAQHRELLNAMTALCAQHTETSGELVDELQLRDGRVLERRCEPHMCNGHPAGWVYLFRDVTAARNAKRLRDAMALRLEAVFEHGGVGVCEVMPDGQFASANATLCQLTGYTLKELLARTAHSITHPDDLRATLRLMKQSLLSGQAAVQLQRRYIRKDGTIAWADVNVAIVRRADGALDRLIAVIHDVTAQRAAAARRVRSEEVLNDAQRLTEIGSWSVQLQTGQVETSVELRRIYGLPPDRDVRLDELMMSIHQDDRERIAETFNRAAASRESTQQPTTFRLTRPDGTERVVEAQSTVLFNDDGTPVELIGATQDITDKQKMHEQLVVSDRMATVGTLAAGVAHEINNPLTALIGNLDLACDPALGRSQSPELNAILADVREAAERIRVITRDLRFFSRSDDEKAGAVDLVRVLDSSLRLANNETRHRARVECDFQTRLPPVFGTASRLGQLFLNLIVNAAQAIPEGHADQNRIKVRAYVDAGVVRVEVSDTGCGMTATEQRNLFRPFYTTKPAGFGTGLGLMICQRIVTAVGGSMGVTSTPGVGTTFTVTLRALTQAAVSFGELEQPLPRAVTPLPLARTKTPAVQLQPRRRLLVVDDEPIVGEWVKRVLGPSHDVTVTTDASVALALLETGASYDLILSDLMMPRVSGMEFYQALKTQSPQHAERVVFMTGGAFSAASVEFLATVPRPRLEKPFSVKQLRALAAGSESAAA